ncbi:ABC transporter permease [Alcaligenaceae bacterium CGII-47]|nr:ABC transporter permease [Alcaligenaceae bacterium CGII-47]
MAREGSASSARQQALVWRITGVVGVACVILPILAGLSWFLAPAGNSKAWLDTLGDPRLPGALRLTLFTALSSSALALAFAVLITMLAYPGAAWRSLGRRLPALLAFPHAAFAIGIALLIAPTGWLARLLATALAWQQPPQWVTVQDSYGLSLMIALAIKESWFMLWMLAALLGEQAVNHQMTIARSLGYSRLQVWWKILLPQILPRLAWPLMVVFAYGLSVVDMALVLGPTTPPTLAVLTWQWLSDPDLARVAQGTIGAVLLAGLLLACVAVVRLAWGGLQYLTAYPRGRRQSSKAIPWLAHASVTLILVLGLLPGVILLLWSLTDLWFFPSPLPTGWTLSNWASADLHPLLTTLWVASACVVLLLPLTLLWLEWGPARLNLLIYSPLLLPALPLAAAQYSVLLQLQLDGTAVGLIWSHMAWVLPYMLITLVGPYRAFDQRLVTTARAMGYTPWQTCLKVKWPILLRPILAAAAIGFSVSVAQYLPTVFSGAGRFQTVTTEAVALSAGSDRRILAVQSSLQMLLPLLAFSLALIVARWHSRHHQGLQ